jgi:hypothetical protein
MEHPLAGRATLADSATDQAAAEEFLAGELERLISLPLATLEHVRCWDVEAEKTMAAIETRFPRFSLELQVWHFFADADIRQQDGVHQHQQHQYILNYITRLRHGLVGRASPRAERAKV